MPTITDSLGGPSALSLPASFHQFTWGASVLSLPTSVLQGGLWCCHCSPDAGCGLASGGEVSRVMGPQFGLMVCALRMWPPQCFLSIHPSIPHVPSPRDPPPPYLPP